MDIGLGNFLQMVGPTEAASLSYIRGKQSHTFAPSSTMSPQFLADSSSTTYLVGGALLLVYLASLAIYRLFLSPLSNIPGPWYAAVSDLWLTSHIARLQQCMTVHKLLEAYGPIVRIGPNRIAFRDTAGVKAVYSVLKFDKGPSYLKLKTA